MNQEQIDNEIARLRLEYDIDAYNAQIKQERRKVLETQKVVFTSKAKIEELTNKILELQTQLEKL